MKQYFDMIHWASLGNLHMLIALMLVVALLLVIRCRKSMKALSRLASPKWRSMLILNDSWVRRLIKIVLFFVGSLFLGIVLLQPQWTKKDEIIAQEGRDLLIAVDISRSMLGQDVKPNRLEFVKRKVKKLLCNLSCERVGLLLFSGDSVMQCPLTTDYAAFFMFLDNLDVETISSGTTTIDGAILKALVAFEAMPDKKTKLLCLFTDGEDFSKNLADVKQKAKDQGVSIFTVGVGTAHGAPIPILNDQGKQIGFEKDESGNIIMSKLNETILKTLSDQTGGKYIHGVTDSDDDVAELVGLVQSFEKDAMADSCVKRYQEQYSYFVAVSLLCFAVEWLL